MKRKELQTMIELDDADLELVADPRRTLPAPPDYPALAKWTDDLLQGGIPQPRVPRTEETPRHSQVRKRKP